MLFRSPGFNLLALFIFGKLLLLFEAFLVFFLLQALLFLRAALGFLAFTLALFAFKLLLAILLFLLDTLFFALDGDVGLARVGLGLAWRGGAVAQAPRPGAAGSARVRAVWGV